MRQGVLVDEQKLPVGSLLEVCLNWHFSAAQDYKAYKPNESLMSGT
jgi:hypothetical protein